MLDQLVLGEGKKALTNGYQSRFSFQRQVLELIQFAPNLAACSSIQELSLLTRGICSRSDAEIVYTFAAPLRIAIHESAHAASLLFNGNKDKYVFKNISFTYIKVHERKFIDGGAVNAFFGEGEDAGLSAFMTILAPDYFDFKFILVNPNNAFTEGGMGANDREQVGIVENYLRSEGIDPVPVLAEAHKRLAAVDLTPYVVALTEYLYPLASTGQTVFPAEDVKRIFDSVKA